jgi:hypothetical protein
MIREEGIFTLRRGGLHKLKRNGSATTTLDGEDLSAASNTAMPYGRF